MPIIVCRLEWSKLGYANSIEKLSRVLKPVSEGQDAEAAVALLLKTVDQDLKVLFVKRTENPADPWSGQMALPGGKRDATDQSLKQTVVRETLEETNINLLDRCRFLGVMETLTSTPRPEMKILPFIVLLEHEPSIKLNEELERFVWISPEELVRHRGTVKFSFGEFPAYIVGNIVIWGLTYRILENLVHTLEYPH
ncbi:MAG: CoA pyrophosphatase [Candidatus Bathyarchaeota archaeon]|nr:CoA pyrophosphatase [Candidatus Bathyarchaeota archaeon]